MSLRYSRRLFLLQMLLLTACGVRTTPSSDEELTVGLVGYDKGEESINQYTNFNNYLSEKTGAIVRLEPTFNETQAIEHIRSYDWALVFARPGLAAIAISQSQYQPLFPLRGVENLRSIIVVRKNSPVGNLRELQGRIVALGQPGSATGYYFPIYNLYGLTLSKILFAPTPKTVLEWVAQGKAAAGALSKEEFDSYSPQLKQTEFRIIFTDPHYVPSGVVLLGPTIGSKNQEQIRKVMSEAPPDIAQEAGYVPNGPLPDYKYMIAVVNRVNSINPNAALIQQKPVRLFKK
ncbi:MAG: PhnD/SsuA/transferrin family substrate-binding protein [Chroococcidiopsidaceae cyanobacterium CP_BM_ER_R8_30]|nr:PhnD/SsuA/transferrin family substrate-binding protein [Chroococcidiopsidaceae cyanobacterium CP_BM_ER_R8_30]